MLCKHQYRIIILYQKYPQLYIADWLFKHNHSEGNKEKFTGMNLNINAIETCTDIPECRIAGEIRHATQSDAYLYALTVYMMNGCLSPRAKVKEEKSTILAVL